MPTTGSDNADNGTDAGGSCDPRVNAGRSAIFYVQVGQVQHVCKRMSINTPT